jgi:hypothetical protein
VPVSQIRLSDRGNGSRKLEDLKAAPKVRKQKHSRLLHIYECSRGRGWHIGHNYELLKCAIHHKVPASRNDSAMAPNPESS